ncbi:MAG: glycosyl hydrolase family 8 [Naasia sp.]
MRRRTAAWVSGVAVASVLVVGGVAVAATGALAPQTAGPATVPSTPQPGEEPEQRTASDAATDFLGEWVDDGRVVRRDQGGDTVSEGQAYGLLIALAADDEAAFDDIWQWTAQNLQRPDGLLAWRWADGSVVDDEPASDADLDAARALALAADRWQRDDFGAEADRLSAVILDRMTAPVPTGLILLPGIWAAKEPAVYNPSYASPAAFAVLSERTGDPRWAALQAGSQATTAALLDAAPLPPDWARVGADGSVQVAGGPSDADAVVRYSYDAARLPIRYAESCDPADAALAARLVDPLQRDPEIVAVLDLGGAAETEDRHPLALAARAGAFAGAGDAAAAGRDLASADALAQEQPTYYGAAWAALAVNLLTRDDLGGCAVLPTATPPEEES